MVALPAGSWLPNNAHTTIQAPTLPLTQISRSVSIRPRGCRLIRSAVVEVSSLPPLLNFPLRPCSLISFPDGLSPYTPVVPHTLLTCRSFIFLFLPSSARRDLDIDWLALSPVHPLATSSNSLFIFLLLAKHHWSDSGPLHSGRPTENSSLHQGGCFEHKQFWLLYCLIRPWTFVWATLWNVRI